MLSLPAPPAMVSSPSLPNSESLPAPPYRTFATELPLILSLKPDPTTFSIEV